jgi:hypothetical protein
MHTCKNYNKLKEWAFARNVSEFHRSARVVEKDGGLVIEDYGQAKKAGTIKVGTLECNAI